MDYLEVPHDFPSTETTRRIISSNLGRLFDPLGLVTPVTILPKILFQMTWEPHLGWDDDVGAHIGKLFHHWLASLKHLDSLEIPRKVTKNDDIVVNFDKSGHELHIFCDARESAYGFSIYARTPSATEGVSSLLTATSRLAPKKLQTLPRLELCAMNIASKTTKVILEVLGKLGPNLRLFAYSDSTIALSWVKSQPYRFQTLCRKQSGHDTTGFTT